MDARQRLIATYPLAASPLVVLDFDGTLSEIVERPETARPIAGALDALARLAAGGGRVVVLSSRPVAFLRHALDPWPPGVEAVGHSGLERAVGPETVVDGAVEPWLETVDRAGADARAWLPPGLDFEDKGLSFTIHYRRSPELRAAADELAARLAEAYGLAAKPGRMNVELRPPVAVDKGTALQAILQRAGRAVDWLLYAGDDVVDLPAFDVVGASTAAIAARVAVGSAEAPPELLAGADLVLPDPAALVGLLGELTPAA